MLDDVLQLCCWCAVSLKGDLNPQIRASIDSMTDRLSHRGPDGGAVRRAPWYAFGHRRLAIIDRAGGDQPMSNEDGSIWIVFNGEIYNHHELRRDLEARGHRFRTHSDTEAIVHAYEECGEPASSGSKGCSRLPSPTSTHARRACWRATGWAKSRCSTPRSTASCTSRAKSRRSSRARHGTVSATSTALEGYLSLGYFLAPATAYRHVRKLEPAHGSALDGARRRSASTGTSSSSTPTPAARRAAGRTRCALSAAVSERLESEVPIGAFLSGGIDSGLVVSYMAGALTEPAVTATVGFDDAAHNELAAAGMTADRYHTEPSHRPSSSRASTRCSTRSSRRSTSRSPTHRRSRPTTSARSRASTSRWRCRATAATKRSAATTGGMRRTR